VTKRRAPGADPPAIDPAHRFASLAGRRGLVLAVSGGPDSTALMLLASRWHERPPVLVVSVDHGLRAEARAEAELVARHAASLRFPWRIIEAKGSPSGNLQDWARRARYACLSEAARDAGFDTIVTAHHQDDQAETFLLRLARGSGVYGLSAMRPGEPFGDLLLSRPLLNVPRTLLQHVVAEAGLETVADPSNADPRFDRVRLRALLPALAERGLDAKRLAQTASHMRRAADALDHYASKFLHTSFGADPYGFVAGSMAGFAELPEEVGLRVLARVLQAVGGADYTPSLAGVAALRESVLAARSGGRVKRTLSGVVVEIVGDRLTAAREWGREGLREVLAPAGASLVWDGRFRVEVPRMAGALKVGALGGVPGRLWSERAGPRFLQTLPGLFQDGTLVAVPGGVTASEKSALLSVLTMECLVGQRLGVGGAGH
jgi:tRNA(Ile)-lysidine synthase